MSPDGVIARWLADSKHASQESMVRCFNVASTVRGGTTGEVAVQKAGNGVE
jgi:hypothetical protein